MKANFPRVTNIRLSWILLIIIMCGVILYWICNTRSLPHPDPGTAYKGGHDEDEGSAQIVVTSSSDGQSEDVDVVRPASMPHPSHRDLFTEFDDVVMRSLYEDDEYAIDYRYDKAENYDVEETANATYSTMRLLNPRPFYEVGDEIKVTIQIQNGYNKRILRGGDRLFVLIKEPERGACARGIIVDHRNGSYTGTVRLLWPGSVDIVAGISVSREGVRVLYKLHREGIMPRQLFAIFQRRFMYEMTLCSPSPFVPGYEVVCNMTSRHHGLPWYCGHPEVMTCAEWTRIGASQPPWPLFKEDKRHFELSRLHQNLPGYIKIKVPVTSGSFLAAWGNTDHRHLIPCHDLPPSSTWRQAPPVGYFLNWRWRSSLCVNTLPNTAESWDRCLSNRRIWLHGDSTLRQWFSLIKRRQELTLVTEKWRYPAWPLPSLLHNPSFNYLVFWGTHELPFTNSGEFIPLSSHKAIHVYIDELPSGNRDIVVIHLYLHFAAYPPTLLRTHVRRTAKAVKDLLARAPEAKVFIKGPHSFHVNEFARGVIDDYWGDIYRQIYDKEFEQLHDRVYYLDFWDMTLASENDDVHPNSTIVEEMIHTLLGYICPE